MIGWYDARTSSLRYVVAMSRREKVIQMSAASLWSHWQEFGRKTTSASQLQSLCGTVLLPHAPCGKGKGHQLGMKVSLYSVTPIPLQLCTKGERAEGTMWRPPHLFGWGGLLQVKDPYSCKLCSLSKPALRLEPSKFCTTVRVSEHRCSFTLFPENTKAPKSCSSSTYLVEPQWRKWLWLRWCDTERVWESTLSIASWDNYHNWKKTLILKGIMEKLFFILLCEWMWINSYFEHWILLQYLLWAGLCDSKNELLKSCEREERGWQCWAYTKKSKVLVWSLQRPRGEDTGSRHLGAEINAAVVENSRIGKPQFETNPKHSHLPLTYSDVTSNRDHKPKVNMFVQTE